MKFKTLCALVFGTALGITANSLDHYSVTIIQSLQDGMPLEKQYLKNTNLPNSELFSVFCNEQFIGVYQVQKEDDANENILAKPRFVLN